MPYELDDDDVAIIIRPINWEEEDGTDWEGDCETAIGMSDNSTLPEFISRHVLDITTMMSTFLDIAADYPEIFALVQQRRDEILSGYDSDENTPDKLKRPKVEKDGNVYTLNFWTKTEGEA
jgi:hypothetical protein